MKEEQIRDFILYIFNEDKYKNNGEYSYVIQIFINTLKSLLPSEDIVGTRVDYNRFEKEMKLWYYYKNGQNLCIENSIYVADENIYWSGIDDSVYARLSPIVFANESWKIARDEILKYVLFTTGNIQTILQSLLVSKLLFLIICNECKCEIGDLKEEIISFSQKEFLEKYNSYFMVSLVNYPGNFSVEFERSRIDIINLLNGFSTSKYGVLNESIEVLKGKNCADSMNLFSKGLCFLLRGGSRTSGKLEKNDLANNFFNYLIRLRKGRIDPKNLRIDEYILPDIFKINEGECFYHSLLNNSKVIKREENNNEIIVYVKTKIGVYKFKKSNGPR